MIWTEDEMAWLRANYPVMGSGGCGRHLNKSPSSVGKKARKLGIPCPERRVVAPHRTFDDVAICEAYRVHQDLKTVARMFTTSCTLISKVVKRHGLVVRMKSRFRDRQEEIVRDYQANELTVEQIGEKHGLSGDRIREGIVKLGLYNPDRHLLFRRKGSLMSIWEAKYGPEGAQERRVAWGRKLSASCTGAGNPMYGKPTPQGAGNGWKGWYRGHYFRSLREACFMAQLDASSIAWSTGECKELTIPYVFNGAKRTYRPDFKVGSILYEIKPVKLQQTPNVQAKAEAARRFCAERGWTYELIDIDVDPTTLKDAYGAGYVRFDRDYETRFLTYLGL